MSFLDYLLDSEVGQRRDINAQYDALVSLSERQEQDRIELRQRIYQLEAENAEIKQVCLTLLQTLCDHSLITAAAFAQQLETTQNAKDAQAWRRVCPEVEPPANDGRSTKSTRNIDFTDIAKASEEMTPYEDKS
ncbi:MAG: hypothetical protein AAGN15_03665 [Cyanobacteria bacterium J06581_3]